MKAPLPVLVIWPPCRERLLLALLLMAAVPAVPPLFSVPPEPMTNGS